MIQLSGLSVSSISSKLC